MAAPIFLHPNLSDLPRGSSLGANLFGSNWSMPLANMQNRRLSKPARSASKSASDTWFDVRLYDFGAIRGICLVNHNLSVTARIKITGWYSQGSQSSYFDPAYRAEFDAYPTIAYTENLPSEAENWWDGKPLSRDIEGLTQSVVHILPSPSYARNWRIEIFDENNPKDYVQIARLWMANGWQPSQAMERGPVLRYETETGVEVAESGAEFFVERPTFRVWTIAFGRLPRVEALNSGLGLMRRAGIHGELFFVHDPDDTANLSSMSFLARFRALKDWEWVQYEKASLGFEMKELL